MSNKSPLLSRRSLLRLTGLGAGSALLAACAPASPVPPQVTTAPEQAPPSAAGPRRNSVGKVLPEDAAPLEQQVLVFSNNNTNFRAVDISAAVYARPFISDLFAIPLTRLNKDFETIPGAATEWSESDDGLVWTFKLRQDIRWSDDTPLTADDFVATFRYMADPKSAYDFAWYYGKGSGNIKHFDEVVAGKLPVEALGVRKGANDHELIVEVSEPTPYLPRLFLYAMPLQAKALAAHGPFYNTNPETAVSCGPFIVKVFSPTRIEYVANPKVNPDFAPYIERVIQIPFPNSFQAYQAGQIDHTPVGDTASVDIVLNDPELSKQAAPDVGDFRTDYFFFDVRKKPFDNLKFRQALAHLLDRDAIVQFITKPVLARPAYSFLAPGFPAANGEALKDIQRYDPALAKQLYEESGEKPERLVLTVRVDPNFPNVPIAQAYADAIKQNLGIEVEVRQMNVKDFMDALLKRDADNQPAETTIDFGFISYGMDFLDPSNMLSVFKGSNLGGRHTWNDKAYQEILAKASPMREGPERLKLWQDAERLLTESCAFVWAVHRTPLNLFKPYVKGSVMLPGRVNTNPGWAWPGFTSMSLAPVEVYIGKEVAQFSRTFV